VSKYRIQAVAQLTGLSSALIRAWEARYRLVQPERTPAGYRLYSDDDVAVLLGAQSLVRQGMAPMQIAQLSKDQIIRAQRLQLVSTASEVLARDAQNEGKKASTDIQHPSSYVERIDRLLAAFGSFDQHTADDLLSVPLQTLPAEEVCRNLLLPLLVEVGERWHRGELSVAAEHFGTTLVRNKLMSLLGELRQTGRRFRVLCACPPGDLHEMGLLLFALEATIQGWDTIYLGANVPLIDLIQTAKKLRPTLVGLSFVMRQEPGELRRLLTDLTTGLDGCSQLLVGGSGLRGQTEIVRSTGCLMMPESGKLADLCPLAGPLRTPAQRAFRGKRSETSRSPKKFLP
jgi:methanogenic corrinoid protein MtbC1